VLDYIRKIVASEKFCLSDEATFLKFEKVVEEDPEVPDEIDIWAVMQVKFEGEIPESYRALNLMLWDWVEKNYKILTMQLHDELKNFITEHYPQADHSSLDTVDDSVIWEDQLDYMPIVNEEDKTLTIEIELVLHTEPVE
jgi:hypothetical protein